MSNNIDKNIEGFNIFTETIIKQIVSKDDEETRKMIIKYAKEKYPKENVRIDFYDEEIVRQIIALGIAEYIKKQDDLYKARILGEFNTVNNTIEEDIKRLEEFKENKFIRDKLERDCRCGGLKIGEIYKITELNPAISNVLDLIKGKTIHLSDEEYRQVIENAQKDIKKEITDEIRGKINERQFELQQEYKDFKDDIKLNTLQEIYYMFKEEY